MKRLMIITFLLLAGCNMPTAPPPRQEQVELGPVINVVAGLNQHPSDVKIKLNSMRNEGGVLTISVSVSLTNPYDLAGYDVDFIWMGSGVLDNANGATDLWNPIDYPNPGLYGYTHGVWATKGYTPDMQVNPYIKYGDFGPYQTIKRDLEITSPLPFKIAYAVSVKTAPDTPQAGWVKTYFGDFSNTMNGLDCDGDGNVYATGHDASTPDDVAFLRKYAPDGDLVWERTWWKPWKMGWDVECLSGSVLCSWYWKDGGVTKLTTDEWSLDGDYISEVSTVDGTYPVPGQVVNGSCVDDNGDTITISGATIQKVGEWTHTLTGGKPIRFISVATDGKAIYATGNWRNGVCNFEPCGGQCEKEAVQTWDYLIRYNGNGCW